MQFISDNSLENSVRTALVTSCPHCPNTTLVTHSTAPGGLNTIKYMTCVTSSGGSGSRSRHYSSICWNFKPADKWLYLLKTITVQHRAKQSSGNRTNRRWHQQLISTLRNLYSENKTPSRSFSTWTGVYNHCPVADVEEFRWCAKLRCYCYEKPRCLKLEQRRWQNKANIFTYNSLW